MTADRPRLVLFGTYGRPMVAVDYLWLLTHESTRKTSEKVIAELERENKAITGDAA